jgi:hypothetical protein
LSTASRASGRSTRSWRAATGFCSRALPALAPRSMLTMQIHRRAHADKQAHGRRRGGQGQGRTGQVGEVERRPNAATIDLGFPFCSVRSLITSPSNHAAGGLAGRGGNEGGRRVICLLGLRQRRHGDTEAGYERHDDHFLISTARRRDCTWYYYRMKDWHFPLWRFQAACRM